jgi:hypothetical protein
MRPGNDTSFFGHQQMQQNSEKVSRFVRTSDVPRVVLHPDATVVTEPERVGQTIRSFKRRDTKTGTCHLFDLLICIHNDATPHLVGEADCVSEGIDSRQ